ncbi:YhcH/YjgK/YiaL family protein [Paenibacillus oenotherae]|uniref:YhcH/YjgK/YiaL family protein n=1 Tax=Paenibacillus oenotherae TaxID=1435645 RepID=A0ABS7D6H5_9BACL|nr:YhcH/YjgK/YiaL family protein [Paenibacillus oenotherae]MBW7475436.1 YhcH/YjgK/YiaL family protein [Paenibacillus oenotherae]
MIYGDLTTTIGQENHLLHPVLQQALRHLHKMDLAAAAPGKYALQGDDMFVLIQQFDTAPKATKRLEAHRQYIDIQYLISGEEELIGYARLANWHAIVEDQLADNDYALYADTSDEIDLLLKPGMYAVFCPNDLHRPGISRSGSATIKKAVVKIKTSLLQSPE